MRLDPAGSYTPRSKRPFSAKLCLPYSFTHVRDGLHERLRGRAGRTHKPLKLRENARSSFFNVVATDDVVVADGSVPSRVDGNPLRASARVNDDALRLGIARAPVKGPRVRDTCGRPQSSAPQPGRHQQSGRHPHEGSPHKLELPSSARQPTSGIWRLIATFGSRPFVAVGPYISADHMRNSCVRLGLRFQRCWETRRGRQYRRLRTEVRGGTCWPRYSSSTITSQGMAESRFN